MRGKDRHKWRRRCVSGITPAYAGKSDRRASRIHGRVGSPPPMRGKDQELTFTGLKTRITPAYAGKSPKYHTAFQAVRDHPRLCGEKIASPSTVITWSGSPPPMRGKDVHRGGIPPHKRITPAYAGKSSDVFQKIPLYKDHPRLCGEKSEVAASTLKCRGSPPPMRGKAAYLYDRTK